MNSPAVGKLQNRSRLTPNKQALQNSGQSYFKLANISPGYKIKLSKAPGQGSTSAFKQFDRNQDCSPQPQDLNSNYASVSHFNIPGTSLNHPEDLYSTGGFRPSLYGEVYPFPINSMPMSIQGQSTNMSFPSNIKNKLIVYQNLNGSYMPQHHVTRVPSGHNLQRARSNSSFNDMDHVMNI